MDFERFEPHCGQHFMVYQKWKCLTAIGDRLHIRSVEVPLQLGRTRRKPPRRDEKQPALQREMAFSSSCSHFGLVCTRRTWRPFHGRHAVCLLEKSIAQRAISLGKGAARSLLCSKLCPLDELSLEARAGHTGTRAVDLSLPGRPQVA